MPTQFQLAPLKAETCIPVYPGYSNILRADGQRSHDPEPSSPSRSGPVFPRSTFPGRSSDIPQAVISPHCPSFLQRLDAPQIESSSSDNLTSLDGAHSVETQRMALAQRTLNGAVESPLSAESPYSELSPLSPNFVVTRGENQPRIEQLTSAVSFEPVPFRKTRTVSLAVQPEKGKSGWTSKLTGSRRSSFGDSGDTSSLSSTTLESQRLEEISLESLTNAAQISGREKSTKYINVYLSQNSTYALFWTQPSIHI